MAGYRPADWQPLDLDRDPTPGDPQRVRTLAAQLHSFADDVSDALRLVKGMAGEDTLLQWAGKSADVFKEQFKDVPKNLKKLKKSYEMCGDALADYWPKLERAQALADKALAKAKDAQSDLSSAKSRLSSADSWVTRATKEADKYKDDPTGSKSDADKPDEGKVRAATRDVQSAKSAHTKAQSDVTSAQSALDAAKKMAEDARKMRDDAAGEAKRKIDEASDAGIPNRHWWQDVGHWFEDNWDTIVTVCKVVVAVVGIIAMIIGGPILGAIVLIAALVVLADTLYKYSKGQASLWDVAFAAMDCIPGGKGITSLGKIAKGLKEMKNLRGGMKAMSLAVRGLGKNARSMLADGAEGAFNRLKSVVRSKGSDPVDMATGAMYLPQSDIELPGLLPLAFTRRVASDYRCGWWFGPSWASTLDERLEIDERGVVHVTDDGLLLAYPHPTAPHIPVMPEAGPRRPLTRHDDGGYRITDPLTGHTRHFARPAADGTALLTRISDRNQHTITFEYDEHGTPLAIRHSGGYHLKLTTDEGRVTTLALAQAAEDGSDIVIKRYGYTNGNLTETVNSSGLPLRFTYDDRLRVTSWTDTNNSRYAYAYDDHDRCVAEGGEAGHVTIALDYDGTDPAWPDCRVTTLTTAEGAVTRFVVNAHSQVVAEIDPLGNTTRTEYDERHHEIAVTDPLGHCVRYVRDEFGRPLVITYPDGAAARFTYDRLGRQTEAVQADGSTWRRTYDERGNCTTVTGPTGVTVGYSYDDSGRLTSVIDALGNVTRLETNAAGLTTDLVDPRGNHERRRYDAFGRVLAVGDSAGGEARLRWTVEGRIAHWTGPDGTAESWEYDGEGNCVRHTDPCGGVTSYEYTHFDLLTATTGPDGARYTYDHDASLRLTRVTNPRGLTWTYTYDPAGRVVSERDFDGRVLRYEYDASGRVTARENALGERIAYERDMLGQVTAKTAGGVVTRYEHDAMGRLLSAATDDSSVRIERDDWGRIVAESVDGRTIAFAYDPLGRRTRRTTPSGLVTEYTYDAYGRRSSLSTADHTLQFGYDVAGREITREVNTALTVRSGWDPSGLLAEQVADTARGTVQHRRYSRRPDGQVVGVEELTCGERRIELDPVGRVTSVSARDWAESYVYDTSGDQTEADWPDMHPVGEARGPRTYEGTRVTRAGRVRYEYDAAGRLVSQRRARLSGQTETWRYTWDVEDRLTSVVTPGGTLWRYRYDVFGRRIAKQRTETDSSGVRAVEETRFTWDGDTLVEQTTTAEALPHAAIVTWDHDGLHPVAQTERLTDTMTQREIDSRFFAIITDLVGTPTELVDERGDIAWRARSTLFGATAWPERSAAHTPLRFPGQYHDSETGLHYNRHRYYAPETGHYISPDPLGLTAAPHPTAYVPNPWTGTDPLGLSPYEPFYRVMSEKEFSRLGPKGEITPRGENFVTQEEDYVRGIAERFGRRGGRNAQKYTHLVRYEMEPGTREALIAAGRGSGDNIAAIKEAFGLHLDEIGESTQFVHVKMERGGLNFGLREGSADVFNSNILRMTYERI